MKPVLNQDMVRAVITRRNLAQGGGSSTTDEFGRPLNNRQVLRHESVSGSKPVKTTVTWRRPSDGETILCEVDVYGVIDTKTGLIPEALIHSLLMMCPKCGPTTQADDLVTFMINAGDCHPRFDDRGKLWLGEPIRCPFMCGWKVRIEEGIAYDVGGRNLFSVIPWAR